MVESPLRPVNWFRGGGLRWMRTKRRGRFLVPGAPPRRNAPWRRPIRAVAPLPAAMPGPEREDVEEQGAVIGAPAAMFFEERPHARRRDLRIERPASLVGPVEQEAP